jgi:hypothetical protein
LTLPALEFAGLAHDPLPVNCANTMEYDSWIIIDEEPTTTIDWKYHTLPITDAMLMIEPLNQIHCSHITIDDLPFIIDSAAMVPTSSDRSDFLPYDPFHPIQSKMLVVHLLPLSVLEANFYK